MGNLENHRSYARRAAEQDFEYDGHKRRIGIDGSACQEWYDQRWRELEEANAKNEGLTAPKEEG